VKLSERFDRRYQQAATAAPQAPTSDVAEETTSTGAATDGATSIAPV